MAAAVLPLGVQRFFDSTGLPLAGGKLYAYIAGTTTPQALYTDSGLSVPFANPIVLDSQGSIGAAVYMLASPGYKLNLTNSAGVDQDGWPVDNIVAPNTSSTTVTLAPGLIVDYGGTSAPSGWLLCDGSAVSRSTYSALFSAIGTNYGAGNGSTTFNVPDFRGRSGVGTGTGSGLTARSIGATGGEETHVLVTAELATHGHTLTDPGHVHTVGLPDMNPPTGGAAAGVTGIGTSSATTDNFNNAAANHVTGITMATTGSDTAHNTMHPFLVATKIIKT